MKFDRIALPPRPRILVIALRRLGDVLLSTPLIRSIRNAWPEARIDALVFAETAGILHGNPDIDRLLSMPSAPTTMQSLSLAGKLLRRYDLAVSTQSGDRPTWFSILAGKASVAPVEDRRSGRTKRLFLQRWAPYDPDAHRVEAMLQIADALGIQRASEVVPPGPPKSSLRRINDYAVVHASPFFIYKRWTAEGWRAVAAKLASTRLTVIATGGSGPSERRYLDEVWSGTNVLRCDGQFDWCQLSAVLAGARIFVGPDTSVTHLAAATGCPTLALYGPTDPRLWGPWPKGGLSKPWAAASGCQRRENVWLLQHVYPCSPCQLEGCERRLASESQCLTQLTPDIVCAAIERMIVRTQIP
jgi:heptosyltransferase-3